MVLYGAVSCNIKEDMANCPGRMILDYSDYPDDVLAAIGDEEQISVFIFDNDDICCDIRTFTYAELRNQGFEFQLPIWYRGYDAVVWQGLNSDAYRKSDMALGMSQADFTLKQISETSDQQLCVGVPDPLWATDIEPIDYCAKITRHRVYMRRLHTEVQLRLQERFSSGNIVDIDPSKYTAKIVSRNSTYRTDYTLCDKCPRMTNINDMEEVGTLRIMTDRSCILSVGGVDREIDLVKYMLQTKMDATQSDQLFLDLNKVWDITLIVKESIGGGYAAVGININGWVTWFSESGLS